MSPSNDYQGFIRNLRTKFWLISPILSRTVGSTKSVYFVQVHLKNSQWTIRFYFWILLLSFHVIWVSRCSTGRSVLVLEKTWDGLCTIRIQYTETKHFKKTNQTIWDFVFGHGYQSAETVDRVRFFLFVKNDTKQQIQAWKIRTALEVKLTELSKLGDVSMAFVKMHFSACELLASKDASYNVSGKPEEQVTEIRNKPGLFNTRRKRIYYHTVLEHQ